MAITLSFLSDLATLGFDAIIDARSPAEYAEDHLPGAINLPVLDDAERAQVGTIYKQKSPFQARKLGAALVARNVARHLQGPLADKPGSWHALVYCWRGGQRSGAFATILAQVGWRVETLSGGYKAWRSLVVDQVQNRPVAAPVVVLDGNTGTAKTEILALLAARGVQVIDLEGLANHRGSLFGDRRGGQPSQKAFEGRLAHELAALDPGRPVLVEAESSKIGQLGVPKQLWAAMAAAPRLRVAAPLAARAEYLARAYGDLCGEAGRLVEVIGRLKTQHPADVIADWLVLAKAGRFEDLAGDLMRRHYDPRYMRHRSRYAQGSGAEIAVDSLRPEALEGVADRIAAALAQGS